MKFLQLRRTFPFMFLLFALLITNCDDKWNEHYNQDSFDTPENNLKESIEQDPQLSTFNKMLIKSGYDKIINMSQSYTIWAPVNESLSGVDTTDIELVTEIVQNHITRGRITTNDIDILRVRMLSGKFVDFAMDGSGYRFGENNVLNTNAPSINGLLHKTNGYVPYIYNLWEYIEKQENLDSLRNYLYGQSENTFDPIESIEIGENDDGQIIYDSIFKYSNPTLEKLGYINYEDSVYTAIMPDNIAWTEAYNRIESYFNFPVNGGGIERKRAKTQFTLVQDMLFRGRIYKPETRDSLISTSGNVFHNPATLFANISETTNLSNGIVNNTSLMPFADTSSWFKKIKVEAEIQEGRTNSNSLVFPRTSFGTGLNVSGNKYILIDPTATKSSVNFPIPNTLSAKYNIYCVFVPASIVDANDFTPTKVKFRLTYITLSNGTIWFKEISPDVNTTYPIGLTKMFVDQFDFKYANVVDDEYKNTVVKLEVINDVTSAEELSGEYSRTMRIDCIILEPVLQ